MNRPNRSLLSFVRGHNPSDAEHEIQPQQLDDDMSGMSLSDLDSPMNRKAETSPTETPTKATSIKERMGLLRMKFGASGSSPKKDAKGSPTKDVEKAEKKVKQEITTTDGKRMLVAGDWDAEKKPSKGILKKVTRGEGTDTGTPSDSGSDSSGNGSRGGGYLAGANQPLFLSAPTTPVNGVRATRKSPSSSRKVVQPVEAETPSKARRGSDGSIKARPSPGARSRPTEKSPRRTEGPSAAKEASEKASPAVRRSSRKVLKSPSTSRTVSNQESGERTRNSPQKQPPSEMEERARSRSSHSPRVKSRSSSEGRTRSRSSHSPRVARRNSDLDRSSGSLKTPVRPRAAELNASTSSLPADPKDDCRRRKVRSHSQPRPRTSRDNEGAGSASGAHKSPTPRKVTKSTEGDEAFHTPTSRRRVGPSRHRSTSSTRSPRSSQRPADERVGSPDKKTSPTSETRRGVGKSKSMDANALWGDLGYKKKSPPSRTCSARARTTSSKNLEGVFSTPTSSKSITVTKKKAPRRDSGASIAAQLEIPTIDSDDESGMRVKYTEVEGVNST